MLDWRTTYINILSIHKGMFWYFVTTKRSQILKQTATFCKVHEHFNFHHCNLKTLSSKYVTKLRILRCNLTIPHQPWPKYRWTNSMERCNMVRLMLGIFWFWFVGRECTDCTIQGFRLRQQICNPRTANFVKHICEDIEKTNLHHWLWFVVKMCDIVRGFLPSPRGNRHQTLVES